MKKKILLGMTIMILMATMAGCANEQAITTQNEENENYDIAVLIPGSVAYFTATKKGADRAAQEQGVNLIYADANWDASTQLSQIEDAISKEVDMIAVCAADAEGILSGIKLANEANIPILTFTNAVGTDRSGTVEGVISYVGQDEVETGILCAQISQKLLGEKGGKVVCIEGRPGTFCQIYRREGFLKGIEGSNLEVVYTQTANWNKEEAMQIAEDLIQKDSDIDLFFCQDDGMAAGVGQVLKEAGLKEEIKVVGLGGSIEGIQALKDGMIDGNTFLSAEDEGYQAIETCVTYLNGETVEKRTITKQVEMTLENVNDFEGEW